MKRAPLPRRAALAGALLAAALPVRAAADEDAPWLPKADAARALEFTGPQAVDRSVLQAELRWLIGEPASEPNLRRAVEVLGSLRGIGGIDVSTEPRQGADGLVVTFRFDAQETTVERLLVTDEGEGPPTGPGRSDLWRHVQASAFSLSLNEGRPFHPWLLELDRRNVRRYFLSRGYVDAEATAEISFDGDLAAIALRATPGQRYRVGKVQVTGLPGRETEDPAVPKVRLKRGDRPAPWLVEQEAEHLRGALCRLGHADARVEVEQVRGADARIDLSFRVVPGLRQRVAHLVVGHPTKVAGTDSAGGLSVGSPFCPDDLEVTVRAIRGELQQYGFLDALVEAQTRIHPPAPGSPEGLVDIRIHVRPGTPAVVGRIWFEGTVVTREHVLRDLVTLEEGDLLLQEEIDASLQNLRASGLFRRASARVLRSGDGQRHYVSFRLEERDILTIDPVKLELTLQNLHLYGLPSELTAPGTAVSLRGSGQELWFKGETTWQAVRLRDAFLMRHLVLSLRLERQVHSWERLEEVEYAARIGLGYSALAKRLQLLPLLAVELTWPEAPSSYDVLPVAHGRTNDLAFGLDFRFDYNDRDAERVPYLGLGVHARALAGVAEPANRDHDRVSWEASVEGNVPLYRNRRGQHVVLHARIESLGVAARDESRLPAHQRVTPTLRGYSASAARIPFDVAGEEVRLGGTRAWSATLQVRLPLPWRRNALAPFLDWAGAGAAGEAPWERGVAAAGLRYDFSMLDERIEGYIYGAWPLADDTYAEYWDTGFGGSF